MTLSEMDSKNIYDMLLEVLRFYARNLLRHHREATQKDIDKVNNEIINSLISFVDDNNIKVNRYLITQICYLYALKYRLNVNDIINEDEIWAAILVHIVSNDSLSSEEKQTKINEMFSKVFKLRWEKFKRDVFQIVCFVVTSIILYLVSDISVISQILEKVFGEYAEFMKPLIIVFSILMNRYYLQAYMYYKISKLKSKSTYE